MPVVGELWYVAVRGTKVACPMTLTAITKGSYIFQLSNMIPMYLYKHADIQFIKKADKPKDKNARNNS